MHYIYYITCYGSLIPFIFFITIKKKNDKGNQVNTALDDIMHSCLDIIMVAC